MFSWGYLGQIWVEANYPVVFWEEPLADSVPLANKVQVGNIAVYFTGFLSLDKIMINHITLQEQ